MRLAGVVEVRLAPPRVRLPVWRKRRAAARLDRMKVLIVDDHPSFRASARRMLEAEGFEVVAEAGTGAEALRAAETSRPELVLLDVHLPDIQGFDVAERLSVNGSAPAVVLTSSRDASDFGPLVERSGARGFIPKSDLSGEALRRILDDRA
jgi:DNA-binding NarL/FixJ family response regulator